MRDSYAGDGDPVSAYKHGTLAYRCYSLRATGARAKPYTYPPQPTQLNRVTGEIAGAPSGLNLGLQTKAGGT